MIVGIGDPNLVEESMMENKKVTVNLEDLEMILTDYETCPWTEISWKIVEPAFMRIMVAMNEVRNET
jgi:hypothetical protein